MIRVLVSLGVVGVVASSATLGARSTPLSPEPTVQAFLYAWQSGQYPVAAALTTGRPAVVVRALSSAYRQLGANDIALTVGPIASRGDRAQASFHASVDLGRGGLPWTYRGHFALRRTRGSWKVVWSPSVIVPGLRPGDRLAVLTTLPPRAPLLDAAGQPLMRPSPIYQIGVRPGQLADPALTARRLAAVVGLGSVAAQIGGQILAAPSSGFLELVQLDPPGYRAVAAQLRAVPGVIVRRATSRLFDSIAPAVTGAVGTETAGQLLAAGIPYRPGATVGLSGLEQAYQRELAGTDSTQIEVETAVGHRVAVLKRWPGRPGDPVRTTIDARVQRAALSALASQSGAAAIVAVRAGTGQVLAVADQSGAGLPAISPLAGSYAPGQAFTVISTSALIAAGFKVDSQVPCQAASQVGGQTFTNSLPEPGLRDPPFRLDFEHACSTAFLGPSQQLPAQALQRTVRAFGIGSGWRLPLPAFSGAMRTPSTAAGEAADVIGTGTVRVSPLGMALAAGLIDARTQAPPSLVTGAPDPAQRPSAALSGQVIGQMQQLMREAVRSGAARAAARPGQPVAGQVGLAQEGTGKDKFFADWFVGYRGNVAFAVLILTRSAGNGSAAAALAGQFAAGIGR